MGRPGIAARGARAVLEGSARVWAAAGWTWRWMAPVKRMTLSLFPALDRSSGYATHTAMIDLPAIPPAASSAAPRRSRKRPGGSCAPSFSRRSFPGPRACAWRFCGSSAPDRAGGRDPLPGEHHLPLALLPPETTSGSGRKCSSSPWPRSSSSPTAAFPSAPSFAPAPTISRPPPFPCKPNPSSSMRGPGWPPPPSSPRASRSARAAWSPPAASSWPMWGQG